MGEENQHVACVDAFMARVRDLSPEQTVATFERGFEAMWQRAHRTLGDVTLTAILDRVLYDAADKFTVMSALKIAPTGLYCDALRESVAGGGHERLVEGIRFVLLEFLTVLGNLTDEILTPALHEELSRS